MTYNNQRYKLQFYVNYDINEFCKRIIRIINLVLEHHFDSRRSSGFVEKTSDD